MVREMNEAERKLRDACTGNKAVEAAAKRLSSASREAVDTAESVARTVRDSSNVLGLPTPTRRKTDVTSRYAAYRK